jgi:exosortase/archaeosortase family protein
VQSYKSFYTLAPYLNFKIESNRNAGLLITMMNKILNSINSFIKKYHLYAFKDVIIFMAILLFFHFLFKIFSKDISAMRFFEDSSDWLAERVFTSSRWILEMLNVKVTAFDQLNIDGNIRMRVFYYPGNNGYVSVNHSCSGLKQFYQWVVLMLLYPGPWKHKTWFIPLGLVIIHFVNLFRLVGMTFVTIHLSQHWNMIHDYVMRPFFYVVMFALWVWWNEKFYLKFKIEKEPAG